ncbi:MAG: SDR family oxidoreductase [Rhodothermales bacterium]|nr:SDR family oxidoreductase [Rhodothermales bacterium]MBO6781073.1 SDR family oxidoreductase [Rhodothermales bacterium]
MDIRTVLLTGPGRGLGLAITHRLLKDGFRVVGVSRSLTDDYAETGAAFLPFDLSNVAEIPSLVKRITAEHGPLYGLVNNAALGNGGLLATMHTSEIRALLSVNLEAAMVLTKYACRSMLVRGTGRIVNISSITAQTGFSGLAAYAATKAGLEGFSRSLSRELGKAGVTVNCVAPGYMETDMTADLQGQKLESIRRRAPLGLARVDDAAAAVAWLLSEDAVRVTGTVLTVDGGSTA